MYQGEIVKISRTIDVILRGFWGWGFSSHSLRLLTEWVQEHYPHWNGVWAISSLIHLVWLTCTLKIVGSKWGDNIVDYLHISSRARWGDPHRPCWRLHTSNLWRICSQRGYSRPKRVVSHKCMGATCQAYESCNKRNQSWQYFWALPTIFGCKTLWELLWEQPE